LTDFEENYRRLRGRFLDRCREDLEVIRVERDPSRLRPVVHRLAGAAGTFGFADLSAQAGEVDDVLVEGGTPAPEALDRLIAQIEQAVAAG
jgi:HPt (histidine-containing phosphotransfer) domain-containing protein